MPERRDAPAVWRSAHLQVLSGLGYRTLSSATTPQLRGGLFCSAELHIHQERGRTGGDRAGRPSLGIQASPCLPGGWSFSGGRFPGIAEGEEDAATAFSKAQALEPPLLSMGRSISFALVLRPDFLSTSPSYFDMKFRVFPVYTHFFLFISMALCVTHLASTQFSTRWPRLWSQYLKAQGFVFNEMR